MTTFDEPARLASLYAAQARAEALFAAIEAAGMVRAGLLESALSDEIHALAAEQFGVEAHWHRKIVRTGANTVATFHDPTLDLMIAEGDILFLDFGPVFDDSIMENLLSLVEYHGSHSEISSRAPAT